MNAHLRLYIIADSQPFHHFVSMIENNVDIPKHILSSARIDGPQTVTYDVSSLNEAFDLHKKIFDYLISTEWYLDDSKVGFCTSGLIQWDEEASEYYDYYDEDGRDFDELLNEKDDQNEI